MLSWTLKAKKECLNWNGNEGSRSNSVLSHEPWECHSPSQSLTMRKWRNGWSSEVRDDAAKGIRNQLNGTWDYIPFTNVQFNSIQSTLHDIHNKCIRFSNNLFVFILIKNYGHFIYEIVENWIYPESQGQRNKTRKWYREKDETERKKRNKSSHKNKYCEWFSSIS